MVLSVTGITVWSEESVARGTFIMGVLVRKVLHNAPGFLPGLPVDLHNRIESIYGLRVMRL